MADAAPGKRPERQEALAVRNAMTVALAQTRLARRRRAQGTTDPARLNADLARVAVIETPAGRPRLARGPPNTKVIGWHRALKSRATDRCR